MKEKKIPMTIRLTEERVESIKAMAKGLGSSPSFLASLMLEVGFVLADELEKQTADGKDINDLLKGLSDELQQR